MAQAARAITAPELALLRTPGDWTRAYLAIYKPNVIYTARLNGAPTSTDMVGQITFDGGTGTLTDVKAEMTLWVGTTAAAKDLGICRIRKEPIAGTIYIGFTSEIAWVNDCYLTIVDHAMLSKKPVGIVAGVTKMDGEHAYDASQHINFDPVPVLSCHAVGTLVEGEVAFIWDASNSWVFDSAIASYLWEAPGSLSIDDDTSATPTITYDSVGNHPVYCTVTATNTKFATGIQFAFRFDENNLPYAVEVQEVSADYDSGGWEFRIKMFADADPANVIEGALAVLFADDTYGSTLQSLGQLANRENIICWGYIAGEENIEWDAEASSVEFSVYGPHYWLDQLEVNPLVLNLGVAAPGWDAIPLLTVDRALWHILHWRTNATALLNITLSDDARHAPSFEATSGSPWSQMNEIAGNIFGRIGCDRLGRFFAMVDPQCVPEADRDWDTVMTLTKKDWSERVEVRRNAERRLAMLSTSGWVVDSSKAVTTLYSLAMGHIGARYGTSEIIDELLASTQAQFNELAGLYMGWKNNEFEFDFTLAQNNRMIDLFPNQFLEVSLAAGDTPRGIAYAGNLIPRTITLQPDPDAGCWSTEISCEAETFAELAVDGDIPASTGVEEFDSSFPPMPKFPPMPAFPLLDLSATEENLNLPSSILIWSDTHGVMYTTNADEDSVIWQSMNSGLTTGERIEIDTVLVTPNGTLYLLTQLSKVFVADGLGGAWRLLWDNDDYPAQPAAVAGIGINPLEEDQVAIFGGRIHTVTPLDYGMGYLNIGDKSGLGSLNNVIEFHPQPATILFNNDGWTLLFAGIGGILGGTPQSRFVRSDAGGATQTVVDIPGAEGPMGASEQYGLAMGTSDRTLQWVSQMASNYGYFDFADVTPTNITGFNPKRRQGMSFSPTGKYGMGADGGLFTAKWTSDNGATWLTTALPVGASVWENCRDNNRWLYGGGMNIQVSLDRGGTSGANLIGNLVYVAPLINIKGIRFIE